MPIFRLLRIGLASTVLALVCSRTLAIDVEPLGAQPPKPATPVSVVSHRWQVKIVESNQVAIRNGSVYDILTYFEQNLGFPKPRFNYLFRDTGLGAADPIYPIYQSGKQGGWGQLLPAMWSDTNRHIDHISTIDTPEGCRIFSTYWVRHIDEFPDRWHAERAEGYTLVDISFEHYTKLKPDAECGRHRSHDPDPNFDAQAYVAQFRHSFQSLRDIPEHALSRLEAKVGLLKLVSEEFDRVKWPRFNDTSTFKHNSLWFYPDGVAPDFGLNQPVAQPGLKHLNLPRHLQIDAPELAHEAFALKKVFPSADFAKVIAYLDGKPTVDFDPSTEPGADAFSFSQIGPDNYYTTGLHTLPIANAREDVTNPDNLQLVSAIIRPYESVIRADGTEVVVPQVRMVFQLVHPQSREPLEQLFIHLNYDAVDRALPTAERRGAHHAFLQHLDAVSAWRDAAPDPDKRKQFISAFMKRYTNTPIARVSFSTSLTGIWAFGTLSRSGNAAGELLPERIVRQGVDVGYYSTAYDNTLFRTALEQATGERRNQLQAHLDALTPRSYRDPRRADAHALKFNAMTCAQCHHMAGRDAVHIALNDGLDSRYEAPTRATEFLYREFLRQLQEGPGRISNPVAANR